MRCADDHSCAIRKAPAILLFAKIFISFKAGQPFRQHEICFDWLEKSITPNFHAGLSEKLFFRGLRWFFFPAPQVYPYGMDKKYDESKNRFSEVIRQSKERRAELNNKTKKKQVDDVELPPRDEEIADTADIDVKDEDEPGV